VFSLESVLAVYADRALCSVKLHELAQTWGTACSCILRSVCCINDSLVQRCPVLFVVRYITLGSSTYGMSLSHIGRLV
jgi:hypothetical protein